MYLVFTYGTLMQGNSNHGYMAGSRFICEATLKGYAIYDLGWYPGIKKKDGASVRGEIYEVKEVRMEAVRQLEGEGILYRETEVCCERGKETIKCVAYVYLLDVTEEQECDGNKLWRRR